MAQDNTRTVAIHALEEAAVASADGTKLGRAFNRANWIWGVLAFFIAVAGVGYALRDQVEHFATKTQVEANTQDIERSKSEIKEMNAVLRGLIDTQRRTLDGVDDVKRILMNRRSR